MKFFDKNIGQVVTMLVHNTMLKKLVKNLVKFLFLKI